MNKSKTDLASLEGLKTSDDFPDRVRRVRDIDLGRWLGYSDPTNCRELIRKKIKAGNLNDSDILRAERKAKMGHGERVVSDFWLTRDQALRVAVWSDTTKGDRVLDMLIAVFEHAADQATRGAFIEARVLQFRERQAWERIWTDSVVRPICDLWGWPVRNVKSNTDSYFAPLCNVMNRIYRTVLGDEVVDEIRARIGEQRTTRSKRASKGQNIHQLLDREILEMLKDDIRDIVTIVEQSGNREDFWMRLERKFRRAMLQTSMPTMFANDKRKRTA